MSCIAPVESLLAPDLMPIPESNTNCMAKTLEFYGNSKEDITVSAPPPSPPFLGGGRIGKIKCGFQGSIMC